MLELNCIEQHGLDKFLEEATKEQKSLSISDHSSPNINIDWDEYFGKE